MRRIAIVTAARSSNGNNGRSNRRTASAPATSNDGYKVGPGRPPKEYQYRPGQSGNPQGRKRKPPSLLPDVTRLFEQALSEKITLKQGDRERTLTMLEAGFKQLAAQFAKGDRHARRDVFAYAEKLGIDLVTSHGEAIEEALAPNHQAILEAYVERRRQATAPSRSSPVLATPELLEDDTTEQDGRP